MQNIRAIFTHKPLPLRPVPCVVEKVVELSEAMFFAFQRNIHHDMDFIRENTSLMREKDGIHHCLLVLGENQPDGILVQADGYKYARTAAYLPGGRLMLNEQLRQAAEHIVQQGLAKAGGNEWQISFAELEAGTGLKVAPDNGIGAMLADLLHQRPEVAELCMDAEGYEITYWLDYCHTPKAPAEDAAPAPMTLETVLALGLPEDAALVHSRAPELGRIAVGGLALDDFDRPELAACRPLLDAFVLDIRREEAGPGIEVTAAAPAMLQQLGQAWADVQAPQQGQTLG